jgi:hypothetical protein
LNLDDGVGLSSTEDFKRLYVPARPEEEKRLNEWLLGPDASALILAGQIGTGKTTLLNRVLTSAPGNGLIRVRFDQTPLDETRGGFLGVLFAALLKKALELHCSCTGLGIALSDFRQTRTEGWQSLRDLLLIPPSSFTRARRVRTAYAVFDENPRQGEQACALLIERIVREIGVTPSIIAEGIDKFAVSSAGYTSLTGVLDFLVSFKTLFEANVIHFFDTGRKWATADKLLVGPLADETIMAMYERRLGSYAPIYRDAFSLLLQYSGGIPRQALRLLNDYYFRRTQTGDFRNAAIARATHRVARDLLQFGFESFPVETLVILKRDEYIEAALLSRPETAHDTQLILYRNWALIQSVPLGASTRWPLVINPLISDAVVWEKAMPEPPELIAARRWARDNGISPMGLNIPDKELNGPRNWSEIWKQLSSSESSEEALNIVLLLDEVAASLFSVNRQDRVMVSYREPQNLDIALDFLMGQAAMYGPFTCQEIHLKGGASVDPIVELTVFLTKRKDQASICVVHMVGDWTSEQLDALDRFRDRFVDTAMLWFVEHEALLRYLTHWPQFRQLFRFYVLEDDFLTSLSEDEIEWDLAILRDMNEKEDEGINRLQRVLNYLKGMRAKA